VSLSCEEESEGGLLSVSLWTGEVVSRPCEVVGGPNRSDGRPSGNDITLCGVGLVKRMTLMEFKFQNSEMCPSLLECQIPPKGVLFGVLTRRVSSDKGHGNVTVGVVKWEQPQE
jgi:hypothetical protein